MDESLPVSVTTNFGIESVDQQGASDAPDGLVSPMPGRLMVPMTSGSSIAQVQAQNRGTLFAGDILEQRSVATFLAQAIYIIRSLTYTVSRAGNIPERERSVSTSFAQAIHMIRPLKYNVSRAGAGQPGSTGRRAHRPGIWN